MAEVEGAPMIGRVLRVLGAGCTALAVNARRQSGAAAYAFAHDLPLLPDGDDLPDGPLAGVLMGLKWAQAQGFRRLATAPCDTPHLPADLVARLSDASGAAYARTSEGSQPLCAIWRLEDLPMVAAALAGGRHPPVRQVLADVDARAVAFPDAPAFANLNSPDLIAPDRR